ncbi:MAG: hypothetical protein HQK61_00375 [Desulfamplus sp.]|nr:hypothetical protein [Desulfamplus sp.]
MTNSSPAFRYHISGLPGVITEDSPLWEMPITGKGSDGILIHEYFEQAQKFIQSENYQALQDGVRFILNREYPIAPLDNPVKSLDNPIEFLDNSHLLTGTTNNESLVITDISKYFHINPIVLDKIDIYLEKHGAFYHPARVEVSIKEIEGLAEYNEPLTFVLNTAISPPGLALVNNEYNLLKHLNELDENNSLPTVFKIETMSCRGMGIAFFLATWFDGYKEFHLTKSTDNDESCNLHLWNGDGSVSTIASPACFEIYEKASEILTHFYNIETFEHISHWHHAAGDFITRPTEQGFDVKLITVRSYDAIVETDVSPENYHEENKSDGGGGGDVADGSTENKMSNHEQGACNDSGSDKTEDMYKGLLLFFLNLTLRMRIDRIDGTGDYCMVDAKVIPFMLNGFFRALEKKKTTTNLSNNATLSKNIKKAEKPFGELFKPSFNDAFKSYLIQFTHKNLYTILLAMTDELHPDSPETHFIRKKLESHSEALFQYIRSYIPHIS